MKMLIPLLFALTIPGFLHAAELDSNDPHAADRQALITVFKEVEAGINAQDVERMVAQMAPDTTVTWLNGEVSRGHDEIRAYYQRMVSGPERILEKYTTVAKIGEHARFFGDVAVADGTMVDTFIPVARKPFELKSNWTSTSAKINGEWKIVSMHLSSNVFTNNLMDEAKSAVKMAAIGGALGGLILSGLVFWWRARK